MTKHHTEQAAHHNKALVDQPRTSDQMIEGGKQKDDGGTLGWAEREAADCWKGTCKTASAWTKNVGETCKAGKEKFDQQPEWAKILEGGAVLAVACGGLAKYSQAADAEANQVFQNGLKRQGTEEVTSAASKNVSGETHIDQQIKYGDGTKTSHLLDPQSATGRKAMQKGMSDWAQDHGQHK